MEEKPTYGQEWPSHESDWVLVQTPDAHEEQPPATTRPQGSPWASMKSELRTQLNAIMEMSQMVLDTELTQEQRGMLTLVVDQAERLQSIHDDIHTTERIEAHSEPSDPVSFFLSSTMIHALSELKTRAKRKELDIVYQVDSDVHNYVTGHRAHLRRILVNIVENVITSSGPGKIHVSVSKSDEKMKSTSDSCDGALRFGISYVANRDLDGEKARDPIFDLDNAMYRSKTEAFDKDTLSLFVSWSLVELVDGKIWTEAGLGPTTLYFSLPFGVKDTYFSQMQFVIDKISELQKGLLFGHYNKNDPLHKLQLNLSSRTVIPPDDEDALAALLQSGSCGEFDGAAVDCPQLADKLKATEKLRDIPILTIGSKISMDLSFPARDDTVSTTKQKDIPSLQPVYILVAEDNGVNQQLLAQYLRRENYKYYMVENGMEALEQFRKTRFNIVLMDLAMPIMAGAEATGKIREWESENNVPRTTILAMSPAGAVWLNGEEYYRKKQFDGHLSKPLRKVPTQEAIDNWASPSFATSNKPPGRR